MFDTPLIATPRLSDSAALLIVLMVAIAVAAWTGVLKRDTVSTMTEPVITLAMSTCEGLVPYRAARRARKPVRLKSDSSMLMVNVAVITGDGALGHVTVVGGGRAQRTAAHIGEVRQAQ